MDADLDTLATALYVKLDELLRQAPQLAPWRPSVGIAPKLSDAELVTLAVMQAVLGSPPRPAGCATPTATCGTCSLPTPAGWLQQAPTWRGRTYPPRHLGSRHRHQPVDRRRLDRRLHPGRVRPLPGDHQALGAGRVGPIRLLRQPLTLLLGATVAPGLHPARPPGRLRVDRRQGRRTPGAGGPAERRPGTGGHPTRPDAAGRQALLRPRVPGGLASWACGCCDRPARANPSGLEHTCSSRCGS